MDCPRVRYAQFNDVVEADLADHGYKVMIETSEQVISL
jgi:dynein heavy chain